MNCLRTATLCLVILVPASYGADRDELKTDRRTPAVQAIAIGEKVPNFSFVNSDDGKTYKLSDLQKDVNNSSGVVVLTFWCSFCGSCRHVEHSLDKLASTYKGRVAVVALDASAGESIEGIREFKREKELKLPVVLDATGHTADLLGTTVTTTTVVIDAKGVLRYRGQFQVRAASSKGGFLRRFDVSRFDTNKDGQVARSEFSSKSHQGVFDAMVKQFKLDPKKTYKLAELRKAIGQTAKKPSAGNKKSSGKSSGATKKRPASTDPQAVIALNAVLAGKTVQIAETSLRG